MNNSTSAVPKDSDTPQLPTSPADRRRPTPHFVRQVLTVLALSALFLAGGLTLIYGIQVFLLAFAGILLGVGLAGLADLLAGWTGMRRGWALALVVILLLAAAAGTAFGLGTQFARQADELANRLPQSAGQIRSELVKMPVLRRVIGDEAQAQKAVEKAAQAVENQSKAGAVRTVRQALDQAATVLGGTVLVFFLGLFFASTPNLYRAGVLHLLPQARRTRAAEVMNALEQGLRRWWLGTLFAMASAGVMTFIGLWLLGLPLALSLAALAALGEFVPNFGPIVAAIPAVMLGFLDSPGKALGVVGLYVVIQTVQSYLITPLVQQRVVDLPPALQIVSQVLMAALFGPLGLLLATPLLTVGMVLVRMLYVQDVLHDPLPAAPGSEN